jgi:hypothetical protein
MKTGDTFESRTGQVYTVETIHNDGGLTISRNSTGKLVKIPAGLIERTRKRFEAGPDVVLEFHASEKNGGISYTSTIESATAHVLNLKCGKSGWTK